MLSDRLRSSAEEHRDTNPGAEVRLLSEAIIDRNDARRALSTSSLRAEDLFADSESLLYEPPPDGETRKGSPAGHAAPRSASR